MIEYITGGLAILAAIFSAFLYFRKPQEELDKKQAVDEVTVTERAKALALLTNWEKESIEKRFGLLQCEIKDSTDTAQERVHSLDVKFTAFATGQQLRNEEMSNNLTKIFTILDERLPKKERIQ